MLQLFQSTFENIYGRVEEFLPTVLAALVLILFGWGLAAVLRAIVVRFARGIAGTIATYTGRTLEESRGLRTVPRVAGLVTFWLTLLVFVSAAFEYLEFGIFAGLLAQFTGYLPNVFLAAMILLAGVAAGSVASQAIRSTVVAAGVGGADLAGRLAQISIVLVSGVVAADQVGIDSTFLMLIMAVAIGTTLGGMALAFGLGSGPVVSNVIASYYVRRMYRPGLRVRIGDVDGRILEVQPTTVMVETSDGRVYVPCRRFLDDVSVLVREQ